MVNALRNFPADLRVGFRILMGMVFSWFPWGNKFTLVHWLAHDGSVRLIPCPTIALMLLPTPLRTHDCRRLMYILVFTTGPCLCHSYRICKPKSSLSSKKGHNNGSCHIQVRCGKMPFWDNYSWAFMMKRQFSFRLIYNISAWCAHLIERYQVFI